MRFDHLIHMADRIGNDAAEAAAVRIAAQLAGQQRGMRVHRAGRRITISGKGLLRRRLIDPDLRALGVLR